MNTAFATYVNAEERVVHSGTMKLTGLMTIVKCDSLSAVTAAIIVRIQSNPNYTYAMALKVYKSEVGKSGMANQNRNNWHVREQNQGWGGRGFRQFGRDFGGGRGWGGAKAIFLEEEEMEEVEFILEGMILFIEP